MQAPKVLKSKGQNWNASLRYIFGVRVFATHSYMDDKLIRKIAKDSDGFDQEIRVQQGVKHSDGVAGLETSPNDGVYPKYLTR